MNILALLIGLCTIVLIKYLFDIAKMLQELTDSLQFSGDGDSILRKIHTLLYNQAGHLSRLNEKLLDLEQYLEEKDASTSQEKVQQEEEKEQKKVLRDNEKRK